MRRYSSYLVLVLSLTLILSVKPAFSQTAEEFQAQQKEIGALKEGMAGLKKDIEDIKKQLQARPAAPGEFKEAIINIKGAPVMGDKKAKLVLMEFTDYQ
jgi:peptidoglycan hydrolase CwlO-like protein